MFRKFMLLAGVVGMMLGLAAICGAVQVDGYCFLAWQTNHEGIKVKFQADSPSAVTDSTYTNSTGYFQIQLSAGYYDVYYSYIGYSTGQILNQNFFSSATLPDVTLYIQLSGPLSGTIIGGIYLVIGGISVENGDSLSIQPGVDLIFNGSFPFNIYGYLFAVGTEDDSIRFIPNEGVNSWGGINFYDSASDSNRFEYALVNGSSSSGIYCWASSPNISHCTVTGNSAVEGGGIYLAFSNLTIDHCTIYDNSASQGGGGMSMGDGASAFISNCTISNNSAGGNGGGIFAWYNTSSIITNIIAEGNSGYGGIFFQISNHYVAFSDFYNNQNGSFTGTPPQYLGQLVTINANGDSCDGFFNIFLDPLFIDPATGDFHLQANSPCIDAGDPTSPLDPDGTITDIGAFYFDQSQMPALEISADSLTFPVTIIGRSNNLPLTLYNLGAANLIISQIVSSNAAYTTSYAPADSLILPGDSLNLIISFSPDSVGLYLAELSITSNGGNAEVSMSGEGISPVSIDLEPLYEPIFIYPWGGEVGYYLSLYNNTTAPQTFDIWIDILKPDSSIYGPVILRTDLTFAPSYQMTRLIRQSIPATAPSGTYSMRGHVGDYQTQEIWSEDSFPFTKVDYNDGRSGKPVSGWSVSGWDDEIGMANDLHPSTFLLHPCSPNPFNPTTVASYELRAASYVKLSVYDISGREVAVLVDGWREAGAHEVTFDAMGLAAGMYFVRLEAGEYVGVEKMVLLK